MKHVWIIDDKEYNLFEGYIKDEYKDHEYIIVFSSEKANDIIGSYKTNNIFEDKLTALNIYEGIISNERKQIWRKINKLNKLYEDLSEKLLNVHNL